MSRRRKKPTSRRNSSIRDHASDVWPAISAPLYWHLNGREKMDEREWVTEAMSLLMTSCGVVAYKGQTLPVPNVLVRCQKILAEAHLIEELSACMDAMHSESELVYKTYAETGEKTSQVADCSQSVESWSKDVWQRAGQVLIDNDITADELSIYLKGMTQHLERLYPGSGEALHFSEEVWKSEIDPKTFPSEHMVMN